MAHGSVSDTRVLLDGLGMAESPRWHDCRRPARRVAAS
jgi:hypothetical protein